MHSVLWHSGLGLNSISWLSEKEFVKFAFLSWHWGACWLVFKKEKVANKAETLHILKGYDCNFWSGGTDATTWKPTTYEYTDLDL